MTDSNGGRIITPPTLMKITQIAVVVRDMVRALKTYTETLGWGPWSVFDYKPPLLHDTRVMGEPVEYRMIGAEAAEEDLDCERQRHRSDGDAVADQLARVTIHRQTKNIAVGFV